MRSSTSVTHTPPMYRTVVMMVVALIIAGCSTAGSDGEQPTSGAPGSTTTQPNTKSPPQGSQAGDKLPGLPLYALVDGNDLTADRINLVLAPWGWDDFELFLNTALHSLSWDGNPYLVDDDGWLFDGPPPRAATANMGVFAIEAGRSNRYLFNVWYTDVEPATPVAWLNEGEPPFRLPDQAAGVLGMDTERLNAELTSVAGQDVVFCGPGAPARPGDGRPFCQLRGGSFLRMHHPSAWWDFPTS
jgi:hypothetical protein